MVNRKPNIGIAKQNKLEESEVEATSMSNWAKILVPGELGKDSSEDG